MKLSESNSEGKNDSEVLLQESYYYDKLLSYMQKVPSDDMLEITVPGQAHFNHLPWCLDHA